VTADLEQIVSAHLRADAAVSALVETRVYTVLPSTKAFPLVRVVRFAGGQVIGNVRHLDAGVLQIDGWAATKIAAHDLVRACEDALEYLQGVVVDDNDERLGAISAVEFLSFGDAPGEAFTDAKHRYRADVRIYAHP
jgi:hypothetical protein